MLILLGVSWQDKVELLRKEMNKQNVSASVFTALDDVACKFMFSILTSEQLFITS